MSASLFLLFFFFLAPCCAQSGNNGADQKDRWLAEHNKRRCAWGQTPLTWSTDLEGAAQRWANNCSGAHGSLFGGENIAQGAHSIETILYAWTDREQNWNGGWRCPSTVLEAIQQNRGHFVQVINYRVTQVGCAEADCGDALTGRWFQVCRYNTGNSARAQVIPEEDCVFAGKGVCVNGVPMLPTTGGQPTTMRPTTAKATTARPTTAKPTTAKPSTLEPSTQPPATPEPSTQPPATQEPTMQLPTTQPPVTQKPATTQAPTTASHRIGASFSIRYDAAFEDYMPNGQPSALMQDLRMRTEALMGIRQPLFLTAKSVRKGSVVVEWNCWELADTPTPCSDISGAFDSSSREATDFRPRITDYRANSERDTTMYIAIGCAVGGAVLIAAVIVAVILFRRHKGSYGSHAGSFHGKTEYIPLR